MKRVWGHVLAGASLLCGGAMVFSACVHDNSSIFIRNVLAQKLQQGTGGQGCDYSTDPTQLYTSSGTLDIALRTEYDAPFLVGNQLVQQANSNQLRTETAFVTIQGAVVRITDADGNEIRSFTRLTSSTISPATGSVPSFEPIFVTIVDPTTLKASADVQAHIVPAALGQSGLVRLVTYTRFFGYTLGGQNVESDEFEFPVDICNGCLINFSNAQGLSTPNCVPNLANGASSTTPQVPCIVGEDLAADCAGCVSGFPACNGAYPNGAPSLDGGAG
ncbi:MAG TPA: hypothetical protein VE987_06310 [Polyangiaceae bacterium]|nr:hypothetical protein [Polyangiaceae bacterium]